MTIDDPNLADGLISDTNTKVIDHSSLTNTQAQGTIRTYTDLDYADFSQTLWNDPDVVSAIVGNSFFLLVSYPGVGGFVVPIDKLGLLAPYVGLASTILVATVATALYVKRVKHRKEKQ